MKLQVNITVGNKTGLVEYDDETKLVSVSFPDRTIKSSVVSYLTTPQDFWIPESNRIDDYRVDKNKVPTENLTYLKLALCTLNTNTGVWVDWKTKQEI